MYLKLGKYNKVRDSIDGITANQAKQKKVTETWVRGKTCRLKERRMENVEDDKDNMLRSANISLIETWEKEER